MSSDSTKPQSTTPQGVSDVCRLDGQTLYITKQTGKKVVSSAYHVSPQSVDRTDVKLDYKLTKLLADGTLSKNEDDWYECWLDADGQQCTCMDYESRHKNIDFTGCKHLRSLRAVGKLPKVEVPNVD